MKIKTLYFILLFPLIFNSSFVNAQGLGFHSSYDELINERTSYTVFSKQDLTINDELTISFDLSIPDPFQFGYICAVDLEVQKHIYSLSHVSNYEDSYIKLNLEGESNLLTVPLKISDWGKGKWNHIDLKFNLNDNTINVSVNNKIFHCRGNKLRRSVLANVYFGKHGNMIDVPDFAIRNLTLKSSKHSFMFSFEEDNGNNVHDQTGKAIGHVENPKWLINDSYHWKHRYTQKSKSVSVVQYDNQNNRIIIAEKDSVTLVNMIDDNFIKKGYITQHPVPLNVGMSCMTNSNKLLSYELLNKSPGSPSIATLNLESLKWDINSYTSLENERHHHNLYFSPIKQQLYFFGGYGDKRYYNSLHQYNLLSDSWESPVLSGDVISPRFFSGMAEFNNHLIVFGGVGNTTGDQSIGKKYFYDCYSIDMVNWKVKKLWEIDRGETRLVSSRNLIFTPDSNSFYTLCYPEYIPDTYLKLYKYNISDGEYKILGDSIPMVSEEIKTNANLYANSNTNELYCVVQQFTVGDSCKTSIYSINNPPLSTKSAIHQTHIFKPYKAFFAGVFALMLATTLITWFIFIRKRKRLKSIVGEENTLLDWSNQLPDPIKNALYLFGDFAVFNRFGKEISYQFSPQMKQLFLFILYKSTKSDIGVTSEQIYDTIWPDKELKNAKNLKGVTINKIRNILTDIDGIDLIFEDKHFALKTEELFYCDYLKFAALHQETLLKIENEKIKNMSQIISRGQFLKSIEIDYLDPFKAEVSNQIFSIEPRILKHYYAHKKYTTCIYFAKTLYCTDELNICAFFFIIQSNLELKKVSEARKHYAKYAIRYQKIQNEDYDLPFSEVVKASKKYLQNIS